jgi:nucleoid-associated protein YgaU
VAPVQASPAPAPAAPQPQEPAPEPSPRGSVYVRYEEPVVRAQPPVVDIEAPAPDPAELAANRRAVRELRARAAGEIYTVQPGDSLRKIARRFYGDPGRFQEIFEANRDVLTDPATVRVGQRLRIPGDRSVVEVDEQGAREYLATLEASQRRPAPTAPAPARRSYTVQRGDNLWRIAQRQMNDGSAAAVQRLFEANRDKLTSPDTIVVGMELTIPE